MKLSTLTISYVDTIQGIDPSSNLGAAPSWGMRGRADLPFKTIAAASRASLPGDTIIINPGLYANDTIASLAALRFYQMGPFVHLSDSSETFVTGSFSTLAQQTTNILAYIDPTILGNLWTNSGGTTQLVKNGDTCNLGTPQTLNGLTIDPAGNWVVSGSAAGLTAVVGPNPSTLILISSPAATDLYKSVIPPANGHMTLIGAFEGGALASGNAFQFQGFNNATNGILGWGYSTATHMNIHGGTSGLGFGFDLTSTNWNVCSASIGGSSGLRGWINGVPAGNNGSVIAIPSGAANNLLINGDPAVGQTGQNGVSFGPMVLLNTDTESGNNGNIRILWENYCKIAVGIF